MPQPALMTKLADPSADTKPWYRYLWPWLVMLPPAASVIAGLTTAWLADGPPALVVDDYADIAQVTVERAERDERARDLRLAAQVQLRPADQRPTPVRVVLSAGDVGFRLPAQLLLELIHPTREELDRRVTLQSEGGAYVGVLSRPPGRLYLQLSDTASQWRLVGELNARSVDLELLATRAVRSDE